MKRIICTICASLLLLATVAASDVVWFDGRYPITYRLASNVDPVVTTALEMWKGDMRQVTGMTPVAARKPTIVISQGKGNDDGFSIYIKGGQVIAAQTYRKLFQLLLRLRANAIWPAMHEGTVAFFQTPGAKAVADSCGIVVGTSHCEPLLRNNVGEWNVAERGRFNYKTNREAVQQYWIERLKEVKVAGYDLELFFDMAWDISSVEASTLGSHQLTIQALDDHVVVDQWKLENVSR